jgi:YggT family protein
MLTSVISSFTDLFVTVFTVLLIIRVVASYIANPGGQFYRGLVSVTEPIIAPVRKVMPQTPGLDLAPLVAYVVLRVAQYLIHRLLGA